MTHILNNTLSVLGYPSFVVDDTYSEFNNTFDVLDYTECVTFSTEKHEMELIVVLVWWWDIWVTLGPAIVSTLLVWLAVNITALVPIPHPKNHGIDWSCRPRPQPRPKTKQWSPAKTKKTAPAEILDFSVALAGDNIKDFKTDYVSIGDKGV